jgi:hypothetical protein
LEEYPGQRKEFLSPEAAKVLAGLVPGSSSLVERLSGAPLEEGIQVPGKINALLRQFRIANESRRALEAASRGGPNLAAINTFIGKSYEFDPQRARKGKDYEIKLLIAKMKSDRRRAMRKGSKAEVQRLTREIAKLQQEIMR